MNIEKIINDLQELYFIENEGRVHTLLIDELERSLIRRALNLSGGNQLQTARILGINRNTLRTKMKKFGLG